MEWVILPSKKTNKAETCWSFLCEYSEDCDVKFEIMEIQCYHQIYLPCHIIVFKKQNHNKNDCNNTNYYTIVEFLEICYDTWVCMCSFGFSCVHLVFCAYNLWYNIVCCVWGFFYSIVIYFFCDKRRGTACTSLFAKFVMPKLGDSEG